MESRIIEQILALLLVTVLALTGCGSGRRNGAGAEETGRNSVILATAG